MENIIEYCSLKSLLKNNKFTHKMDRKKRSLNRTSLLKEIVFSLFVVLLLLSDCAQAQNSYGGYREQKFAMEPQDQTAIVGSRVTLPCRVVSKAGQLQWTKDDFGLGTHRNLSGYERYSMIGSDEEGDFSLDIYPVHLDDDAKYQCQVSAGPQGQPVIRSRYAELTVLVAPESPRILQGATLHATEDQQIELECVSSGGKPAAEITWIDSNGVVLTHQARYSAEIMSDGRRFAARSVLRFSPSRAQHGANITCQAQNTADRAFRSTSINLQVRYAPVVTVKVLSGASASGRIPEGAEVRLGCTADANPNDVTYRWYLNDEEVIGDYTTEAVFYNVSKEKHDSIVKCEVHNTVGKSEDSETLDIMYKPKFRAAPIDASADLGGSVTLNCDVDGNPPPEITWLHEEQDRWSVVGTTPSLTLTVDRSTAGRYTCKALVAGFAEIQADATLYIKGPPKIVSPQNQLSIPGEAARIVCHVISVPRPVHLVWTFQGREINTHHEQDYTLMEEPLSDGVKSILVIRNSQDRHFGAYNCSVTNEYGADVLEIHLNAQTLFSTLILLGVLGGVILGILLVGIIVCICCRGKHNSADSPPKGETISKKPDVMMDAMDRTLSISDMKLDLKHKDEEYGSELPLTGPVPLPVDKTSLLMQYARYSNDYSDHTFHSSLDYKDGHNNNGYSSYVDFNRDYNPPPSRLHPMQGSVDNHSIGRLSLQQSPSGAMSVSSSLQRKMKGDANSIGLPSATYEPVGSISLQGNGYLKSSGSGLLSPGVDIRYAATYGNPYLRSAQGINTVNTANPAATPAPPPYNSIRNSMLSVLPVGSSPTITPPLGTQQQAAPQTKKSPSSQQSLATHV